MALKSQLCSVAAIYIITLLEGPLVVIKTNLLKF